MRFLNKAILVIVVSILIALLFINSVYGGYIENAKVFSIGECRKFIKIQRNYR